MPGYDIGHSTMTRQALGEDSSPRQVEPPPEAQGASEPITLQVAFAGHNRAPDLGHRPPVLQGLFAAFALIKAANNGPARLLTGLASGADELAAAAWRQSDLGPIHAVFPFLHDAEAPMVGPNGAAETATWLDGAAAEAEGRNPHLKQTRLIVETADLLVVVWTGERARGAGGTADAVRCALDLGLPVLWIKPSEPHALRLIRSEDLPSDFDFTEFQEALQAGRQAHVEFASPENLREALSARAPEPAAWEPPAAETPQRLLGRIEDWLHGWLWKTYGIFRKLVGGRVEPVPPGPDVPADLASQPGFQILTAAYLKADSLANRLSAVHRSEQVLLIIAMVTAAIIGSAWVVWPAFKITAVTIELLLALGALWVWSGAQKARQHERWSEERLLAEQLRHERAGWALGVSVASTGGRDLHRRTDDQGRQTLRSAGLPHGKFDPDRVRRWGAWSMNELIDGQSAYHRVISARDGRIAHRIHMVEDCSFIFLLLVLGGYLAFYIVFHLAHAHPPHWMVGTVAMTGTIVPAIAAASMAMEAKLEFAEQSERSQRVATHLDELSRRIEPDPSFSRLQSAARSAMRWHIAEASQWGEGAQRRRLFRP